MTQRFVFLRTDEIRRLDHWCRHLWKMFPNALGVYLVGSVLESHNYNDVDIRVVMDDERVESLCNTVELVDLNYLLSVWGNEQTGLPIDCRVQKLSASDSTNNKGKQRNPRGLL